MRLTRYVRQHHVGLVALFIALTGTAYAGTQVANHPAEPQVLKKKKKRKKARPIPGPTGPPGAAGLDGTARAYGRVGSNALLSRSKNVTGVTRPSTGVYCIALAAGIDASATGLVATPDFFGDSTNSQNTAHVEFASNATDCPAGQLEVRTFKVDTSGATSLADPQGGVVNAPTYTNTAWDEAFFFIVP